MARILWLTSQVPDLTLGGGNIRQAHLLAGTASEHEVHLALIGRLRDAALRDSLVELTEIAVPTPRPAASGIRRPADHLHAALRRQPEDWVNETQARAALRSIAAREADYDIVCVENLGLTPLLAEQRRARWTADLHHLPSVQADHLRTASTSSAQRWFWTRQEHKARRLERWVVASYDRTVVCSEDDAAQLRAPVLVVPNGVDFDAFAPTPPPPRPDIVFIGSLDYRPNIDGVQWLCNTVMPIVLSTRPDAMLRVVGRRPTEAVAALGRRPGIEVHADVESVGPFLRQARVAVVPLFVGSGTRLKALEAMSAGRPVVGTTIGLSGLGLVDGVHARIADDAPRFASAILDLLDDQISRPIVAAGRRLVEDRFAWSSIGREYAAHLAALAATPVRAS
jgi:glycosyltransferase involved in cell wall biosynthesis